MQIGSHNTFTYLPVRKWWMRLIAWTARCQSLTLEEQYKQGARVFDLRLRFDGATPRVVHGLVEYKIDWLELVEMIRRFYWQTPYHQLEEVSFRVIHDVRNGRQARKSSLQMFQQKCRYLEKSFPLIHFFGGSNLYTGMRDYPFQRTDLSQDGRYASAQPPFIDDLWPWLYARLHNKQSREEGSDKDVMWLDFVEY